jgi:hypothetical protein
LGWFRGRRTKGRVARFRQVNTANSHAHHDAFEFPDGKVVMVTRLIENQNLTVLQLPVGANDAARQAGASTASAQAGRPAAGAMASG